MWSDWITVNSQQLVPLITRLFCYVFNWGVYWTRKLFPSPGNLPDPGFKPRSAIQETQIQSLGQEDLLEKRMATHSSILAWRISWTEEPGGLQSMGLQRAGHDWVNNTHTHIVALWYCVVSWCTIKWISSVYTYTPSLLGLSPIPLHPTHLDHHRAMCYYSRFPLATYLIHDSVCMLFYLFGNII